VPVNSKTVFFAGARAVAAAELFSLLATVGAGWFLLGAGWFLMGAGFTVGATLGLVVLLSGTDETLADLPAAACERVDRVCALAAFAGPDIDARA